MSSIVVTDGEQRSALATVRSLGRAGHTVHVCAARDRSLAGASRYCTSETRLADPLRDPSIFAGQLATLCASVTADVLLPITEASLLAVLPVRDTFGCAIPFPTMEQFTAVCDKELVLRVAEQHGIAVPKQRAIVSKAAIGDIGDLAFPVVLKPARSVSGPADRRAKASVVYAHDEHELGVLLSRAPEETFPILLQERIEGPGCAISLMLWDGTVRAAFGHRRLREKPPSGGVSVLRESMLLDADLLARSTALLKAFDWQGVAMVEFKVDARSNTPYLMEINGRLWGSLQLAIDAGVDFPGLLVQAATTGFDAPPTLAYPAGVRTWWEFGDLDHVIAMVRHSPAHLNLPSEAPGKMRTILNFFRGFDGRYHREIYQRDDRGPFWREARDWVARR